jgi:hypothetical protein
MHYGKTSLCWPPVAPFKPGQLKWVANLQNIVLKCGISVSKVTEYLTTLVRYSCYYVKLSETPYCFLTCDCWPHHTFNINSKHLNSIWKKYLYLWILIISRKWKIRQVCRKLNDKERAPSSGLYFIIFPRVRHTLSRQPYGRKVLCGGSGSHCMLKMKAVP